MDPPRRAGRLARLRYLPHGRRRRPRRGGGSPGTCLWRREPADRRCVSDTKRALRQHQHLDDHDRREDGRCDPACPPQCYGSARLNGYPDGGDRIMEPAEIRAYAHQVLRDATIPELPDHYSGKVRDNYDLPDGRRVIIATDRLSAFDRILCAVPFKGQVLTQTARSWF